TSDPPIPRGIFINQAAYALEILKKHGMDKCDSIGTPLATKPKLDADLSGKPVDQTNYRSMIRSLMYLTSSRPDLILKGYYKTSRGIQFLGDKLVSWMSKKHDCTAMSLAEAETGISRTKKAHNQTTNTHHAETKLDVICVLGHVPGQSKRGPSGRPKGEADIDPICQPDSSRGRAKLCSIEETSTMFASSISKTM
ncbi:retrovirus-related pol polyprotein from transposon TNT 1-94, partial [Tanacetum coccineum]